VRTSLERGLAVHLHEFRRVDLLQFVDEGVQACGSPPSRVRISSLAACGKTIVRHQVVVSIDLVAKHAQRHGSGPGSCQSARRPAPPPWSENHALISSAASKHPPNNCRAAPDDRCRCRGVEPHTTWTPSAAHTGLVRTARAFGSESPAPTCLPHTRCLDTTLSLIQSSRKRRSRHPRACW